MARQIMPLRAGELRNRIDIMRAQTADNGSGGYAIIGWGVLSTIWAEVLGLDGRESVMDQVLQGISVYRVRIRYRSDLKPDDQLRYGSVDLNIRSISDPDGRRTQLVIMADTSSAQKTT